jgi:hypothetical protein
MIAFQICLFLFALVLAGLAVPMFGAALMQPGWFSTPVEALAGCLMLRAAFHAVRLLAESISL